MPRVRINKKTYMMNDLQNELDELQDEYDDYKYRNGKDGNVKRLQRQIEELEEAFNTFDLVGNNLKDLADQYLITGGFTPDELKRLYDRFNK